MGCGTGALTFAIAENTTASKIVGIDLSEAFIDYARAKTNNPCVTFEVGDAQNIRFPNASFDCCLALLVMSFIPDATKAAREMRRVTRPSGIVATAMWDNTDGGNELNQCLWDAAVPLDPKAPQPKDRPGSYGTAEELRALWTAADLRNIQVENIVFPCGFDSLSDFWQLTEGEGPAGAYLKGLSEDHRAAIRERLRQNIFGSRADGPFTLKAKAWGIRGLVP